MTDMSITNLYLDSRASAAAAELSEIAARRPTACAMGTHPQHHAKKQKPIGLGLELEGLGRILVRVRVRVRVRVSVRVTVGVRVVRAARWLLR